MTPVWQMYLTKVQDVFKYGLYNYLKVGIPENIPQNKLIIYAQYFSTFEKVCLRRRFYLTIQHINLSNSKNTK